MATKFKMNIKKILDKFFFYVINFSKKVCDRKLKKLTTTNSMLFEPLYVNLCRGKKRDLFSRYLI